MSSLYDLPYDILENHIVPNKLSRKHYLMFNITCKKFYNIMKENHTNNWLICDNYKQIIDYILKGYRNIRINNLEFFVVNIHKYSDDRFRLFTPCGRIIYFDYYLIRIPVFLEYNNIISKKMLDFKSKIFNNNIVLRFSEYNFEILTESYPYNAYSRPIQIRKI